MTNLLSAEDARELVESHMFRGGEIYSTQQILDSGIIPKLKGYNVKPGKVSDSVFGGKGSYFDKSIGRVEFENPPLQTRDGIPLRIMVRTQRISTHDINRGEIPFKDQILAVNHNFMRSMFIDILGTSQFEVDGLDNTSVVIAAENLKQIPFENVLRAYMAKSSTETSLYRHYMKGERKFCGHKLPDDLIPNGKLPYVMDTPSTKSEEHDESISPETLFERGLATRQQYTQIRNSSIFAFATVSIFLTGKGLIGVDTKTEHGINKKRKIVSQDEIWTMDSSRFWLREDYDEQLTRLKNGEIEELDPKSFSKEFARYFSRGNEGYTDEQRLQIAVRYIEGIQHLTGKRFNPDMRSYEERVIHGLEKVVEELVE